MHRCAIWKPQGHGKRGFANRIFTDHDQGVREQHGDHRAQDDHQPVGQVEETQGVLDDRGSLL